MSELETMADGQPAGKNRGMDYAAIDAKIEAQRALVKEGKLDEALENLLNLEKQMRLAADITGTKKVVLAIVQFCHEAKNWKALNENIVLLSKRRAQLKQAVAAMVQEAMGYIEDTPDQDTRIAYIKTLSSVTAGKIYLEIERARLTRKLAAIKESQGDVKEAASIMQDVAVETFGAMAKTEKIAFILDQVRLCLDHADFMRAQILAKKINPQVFREETGEKKKAKEGEAAIEPPASDVPTMPELKRKFYELMIRYHKNGAEYLEICRCYQAIYESTQVKGDPVQWIPVLKKICWYLVLSPHGSMQQSLLHAAVEDKHLNELPKLKSLLRLFTTMEVIHWPKLESDNQQELEEAADIFGGAEGKKALEDLRLRVIEQDILVVSKYYTRITSKRLSELLDLSPADTEKHLSDMVVGKSLYAKIDKPAGIISFQGRQDSNDLLNAWARSIEKLLDLVETSCHQIHKETMVHKVALKV